MSFIRVAVRAANGAIKEIEHSLNGKTAESLLQDLNTLYGGAQQIDKAVHFFTDKDGNAQQRHLK